MIVFMINIYLLSLSTSSTQALGKQGFFPVVFKTVLSTEQVTESSTEPHEVSSFTPILQMGKPEAQMGQVTFPKVEIPQRTRLKIHL